MVLSAISVLFAIVFAWGVLRFVAAINNKYRVRANGLPYPPGPEPKLIIGNALDFPVVGAPEAYMKMGHEINSSIIHLEALGQHIIILNKLEDADELLERRAGNYTDRPDMPLINVLGWEYNMAVYKHDDVWRLHRKICQQNFRKAEATKYIPVQTRKVHELLLGLSETPEEFETHNKKLSIAIPMSTMYGYDIKSLDDPVIQAVDESTRLGAPLFIPGGSFVNVFPSLARVPAWVPGATTMKIAKKVRQLTEDVKRIPIEHLMKQMSEGIVVPSLVSDMLERKFYGRVSKEEEDAVKNIAYTVYGGASDTTQSLTKLFLSLMATHPDIQKIAQEEIDRVIGIGRLPEYDDRLSGRLPYVEAIYLEVLRLGPPVPLCVPHAVSNDDIYKGYFIPKGATILPNIWAMNHDERLYPEPYRFMPERFIDDAGNVMPGIRSLSYGFGRRVCVGKHVASSTMWLIIVSVLSCFNITKAKDELGNEIEIDDEFEDSGLLRHRAPFKCSFIVRSPDIKQLILDANS